MARQPGRESGEEAASVADTAAGSRSGAMRLDADAILAEQSREPQFFATVERVEGVSDKVKVTPWKEGEGCQCRNSRVVPKDVFEGERTGNAHVCCGKLLPVWAIYFHDGATVPIAELFFAGIADSQLRHAADSATAHPSFSKSEYAMHPALLAAPLGFEAPTCTGNACSAITLTSTGQGYSIHNSSARRVRLVIQWTFGLQCLDPTTIDLAPGETKQWGNGGYCNPYQANYL